MGQLIALHLMGNMGDDHRAHLMQGFTKPMHDGRNTLKIKDRATGLIVQEHIPKCRLGTQVDVRCWFES